MSQRRLPPNASIAEETGDGRLCAPSATRNAEAITALLTRHAPARGQALEIASGTGQHVAGFARALPGLIWQPSEVDAARRASIGAWAEASGLTNLRPAIALDACATGWGARHAGMSLVVVVNLLHLISTPEALCLITEVAQALDPAGRFVIYGPFLRDGVATSEGDARFHASLIAQDPEIGYKTLEDVIAWQACAGLALVETAEMPANNLGIVTQKGTHPETQESGAE